MAAGFADTVKGKVLIGVTIACIVGFIGHVSGRLIAPNLPPVAQLSPKMITVNAGQVVEFDAATSSDPASSTLSFDWKISGHSVNQSSVGHCNQGPIATLVTCLFTAPGTFSVSVAVTNSADLTSIATSPVTVLLKDGFIGLFLKLGVPSEHRDNAYRTILQIVDWPRVQEHVARPIVLYDPDLRAPVFAASITKGPDNEIDPNLTDGLRGSVLLIPSFRKEASQIISTAVQKYGGQVRVMNLRAIPYALTAGKSNNGFALVGSPANFKKMIEAGSLE